MKTKTHKPRGFAAMDPERQREIASRGGKAAQKQGNAYEFSSEEAREAGRKGGLAVSQDREHMSRIGHIGRRGAIKNAKSTTASN